MTDDTHYRKLERMYLSAPTNQYYTPTIRIAQGAAEVGIEVREDFFHTARAVHGSVFFKALDDASYFAVSSLEPEVFVLTVTFHLYLLRPVSSGSLIASGQVVHQSDRLYVAEAELKDGRGRQIARGSGSFMPSSIRLGPEVGYQ